MSLTQITLTTNKTVSNVGDYIRKIGQGEQGQVLPVVVTDANGAAYDLTGKSIIFSENKDSGKLVVDDGKSATSGTFDMTDPANGEFSYTLQDQVYTESGTAWFDIVSADGKVIDTTVPFRIVVISSEAIHVTSASYVSTLEALQANYQAAINNAETNTQNTINSLTDKINQAISNGQNQLVDQLTKLLMEQYIIDYNNQFVHDTVIDFNSYLGETQTIKLNNVEGNNGPFDNTTAVWGWLTTYSYDSNSVIQEYRGSDGNVYWRQTSADASKAWTWHKRANQDDIDSLNNDVTSQIKSTADKLQQGLNTNNGNISDIYTQMQRYMVDYNNNYVHDTTIDFNSYLGETQTIKVANVKGNNGPFDNTTAMWGWLTTYSYDNYSVQQVYRGSDGNVYWRQTSADASKAWTWHKRANQDDIDSLNQRIEALEAKSK